MTRKRILSGLLSVGLPAAMVAFASPALADGGIVRVGMHNVAKVTYLEPEPDGTGGIVKTLAPGARAGGVEWVTSNTPFYATVAGGATMCLQPGQFFYPNNGGAASAARIQPTVRC